ncbi:MAG TPA: CsgG/HfaB family protein, partial [Spirochaetota bacterium]|nr:CsgG/HfaB family protein [Spirochaetota bacterium]
DMLTTGMFNTGKFGMVERARLNTVLKEQKISNSDDFNSSNAAKIGELLGANYIITGKITSAVRDVQDKFSHYELNATITFNISVLDSSTGKIFKSVEGVGSDTAILVVDDRGNVIKGPAEFRAAKVETKDGVYTIVGVDMSKQFVGATKKAIENVANKLEASFPIIGYVLTGDGTKIMTDVGSERGAKKDDYFIVIRLGKEIIHPATKKVIGREKEVIAGALIESVGEKESNAKILKLKDPANAPTGGDVVISISGKYQSLK